MSRALRDVGVTEEQIIRLRQIHLEIQPEFPTNPYLPSEVEAYEAFEQKYEPWLEMRHEATADTWPDPDEADAAAQAAQDARDDAQDVRQQILETEISSPRELLLKMMAAYHAPTIEELQAEAGHIYDGPGETFAASILPDLKRMAGMDATLAA